MFSLLQQEQEERWKLYGDRELLIKDLKENHMTIEEPVERYWCKWKIVHIDLPEKDWFKWFKFDYFISDDSFIKYDSNLSNMEESEAHKKALELIKSKWLNVDEAWHIGEFFSPKEIWSLFEAINQYMRVNWVLCKNLEYENCDSTFLENLLWRFGDKRTSEWSSTMVYFMDNWDYLYNNKHNLAEFTGRWPFDGEEPRLLLRA